MKDTFPLPNTIREARLKQQLTQKALAEQLGVGEATIRAWEAGRNVPSLSIRSRLEEVLEISIHNDHDPPPTEQEEPRSQEPPQPLPFFAKRWPQDENRSKMLKRVKARWIEGVLNHALSPAPLTLEFQEQLAALDPPSSSVMQEAGVAPHVLPLETSIVSAYDAADGALLILGDPGMGKTTLLLELTRTLLERAATNELHPIPVVFNLSSWAEKRAPLDAWLIEELNRKYQVPRPLAATWIADDRLILLLDGLDEVSQMHRAACILMLNRYRHMHPFLSLVVCCRSSVYFEQRGRLQLNKAIQIHPLAPKHIDRVLASAGKSLAGLRAALRADPVLQDVVSTPLMLSVCATVYQNTSREEILASHSQQERRTEILEHYIIQVWRRGQRASWYYPAERVIAVISWLAKQMHLRDQSEFYLERVQPTWLESEQRAYQRWVIRVVFGINLFVQAGLFACFRGDSEPTVPGLFYWLGSNALGNSLLGWMAPGVGGGLSGGGSMGLIIFFVHAIISLTALHQGPVGPLFLSLLRAFWRGLRFGVIFGGGTAALAVVLLRLVGGGWTYGIQHGVGVGILEGFLIFLVVWLVTGVQGWRRGEMPLDQRPKTPSTIRRRLSLQMLKERLIDCSLFFCCGFVGMGSIYALQAGEVSSNIFFAALFVGIGQGVMFGLVDGPKKLIPDLGTSIQPAEIIGWSWSNVFNSLMHNLKRGVLFGGAIALPMILGLTAMSSIFNSITYAYRYGLIYGLIVGIINGVAAMLTGLLNSGWSSSAMPDPSEYSRPNEGIRRSYRNAVFAASLFGPIGGLLSGLCCGFCFWLAGVPGWFTLSIGLTLVNGVSFALRFWSAYGGQAWIEHSMLRWFLARSRFLPWNCLGYLDEATRRTLLRKVGGGYMFSHHLFMEYFVQTAPQKKDLV